MARANGGTSSASSTSPSGSIQTPKSARMLPPISSAPAGIRTQREDGLRTAESGGQMDGL